MLKDNKFRIAGIAIFFIAYLLQAKSFGDSNSLKSAFLIAAIITMLISALIFAYDAYMDHKRLKDKKLRIFILFLCIAFFLSHERYDWFDKSSSIDHTLKIATIVTMIIAVICFAYDAYIDFKNLPDEDDSEK